MSHPQNITKHSKSKCLALPTAPYVDSTATPRGGRGDPVPFTVRSMLSTHLILLPWASHCEPALRPAFLHGGTVDI